MISRQGEKGNKKVTVVCIDHALKLVKQFGLSIGENSTIREIG